LGSRETEGNSRDDLQDAEILVDKPTNAASISFRVIFFCLPKPCVGRSSRLGGTSSINQLRILSVGLIGLMCHVRAAVLREDRVGARMAMIPVFAWTASSPREALQITRTRDIWHNLTKDRLDNLFDT
jgi:hypothetical protein